MNKEAAEFNPLQNVNKHKEFYPEMKKSIVLNLVYNKIENTIEFVTVIFIRIKWILFFFIGLCKSD